MNNLGILVKEDFQKIGNGNVVFNSFLKLGATDVTWYLSQQIFISWPKGSGDIAISLATLCRHIPLHSVTCLWDFLIIFGLDEDLDE